jgi:hypothetical protein
MQPAIDRELTHHQYLRSRLEEEFPDADEETLVDTLEGLSNLPDMLAEVCRSMLDDQAMSGGGSGTCKRGVGGSMPGPVRNGSWCAR